MKVLFSPPDIGEEEIAAVTETLRSGWITTGEKTKQFEREIAAWCHTARAVCVSSATAALELTLRLLGIGAGDEVITSAYTYTATASVIQHVGAKIVLVDTQKDAFEMDYEQLEQAVNARTKAIIPVDLAGVICDYDRIFQIVEQKRGLFRPSNPLQEAIGRVTVIADAAHAFGAERHGKICGSIADFTCFSFHAVKNLTTAEGGAVTWRRIDGVDDEGIYRDFMLWSLHGQSRDALSKTQAGGWEYDILRTGYKANMTDISASIGLVQLRRYPKLLQRRREIIQVYDRELRQEAVQILRHEGEGFRSSGHLYMVRLLGRHEAERNALIAALEQVGVATNVHYKPLPLLTAYRNLGFSIEDYPNAFRLYENEITLPLHTRLTSAEIAYVVVMFQKLAGGRGVCR